ncbi:MAG: hypothetical protein OEM41_08810 [Ignavibacteria bacterium]|nr:hypothetical protein [Ignavibacteria bacterium]
MIQKATVAILILLSMQLGFHSPMNAQTRIQNSLSIAIGAYAASGFGNNLYGAVRYNYFFLGGRYFVEASLGVSSLKSRVLENVSRAQLFDTERLFTYEFVIAFDAIPAAAVPFVVVGVAGVNQGGTSSFAGVLGLGKRIPIPGLFGTNQIGFRYDVRDQIFSQTINNSDPFIVHNIVFSVGLQLYF